MCIPYICKSLPPFDECVRAAERLHNDKVKSKVLFYCVKTY